MNDILKRLIDMCEVHQFKISSINECHYISEKPRAWVKDRNDKMLEFEYEEEIEKWFML